MPTVTVFNRAGIKEQIARPGVVVISICDPNDPLILQGWERVLRLEFDDVSEREEMLLDRTLLPNGQRRKAVPFTEAMARQIMGVLAEYPTYDFIVHCNAGVSRSVAVARFISEETGRTLHLLGGSASDETANGHVLRLLHRQLWGE